MDIKDLKYLKSIQYLNINTPKAVEQENNILILEAIE